jgi:hypothetical protein
LIIVKFSGRQKDIKQILYIVLWYFMCAGELFKAVNSFEENNKIFIKKKIYKKVFLLTSNNYQSVPTEINNKTEEVHASCDQK